jgi:hypothetical protein
VTCPVSATCSTATAVATVGSASATMSAGVLTLSIQGDYTACCSSERFIIGWAGARQ